MVTPHLFPFSLSFISNITQIFKPCLDLKKSIIFETNYLYKAFFFSFLSFKTNPISDDSIKFKNYGYAVHCQQVSI